MIEFPTNVGEEARERKLLPALSARLIAPLLIFRVIAAATEDRRPTAVEESDDDDDGI